MVQEGWPGQVAGASPASLPGDGGTRAWWRAGRGLSDTQRGHFSKNSFQSRAALTRSHSCCRRRLSPLNFNELFVIFSGKSQG